MIFGNLYFEKYLKKLFKKIETNALKNCAVGARTPKTFSTTFFTNQDIQKT